MAKNKIKVQKAWKDITYQLSSEKELELSKGHKFKAVYDSEKDRIKITPKSSGITRFTTKMEWENFSIKYNEVIDSGYDALQPGHYLGISFNASYLVAIVKAFLNRVDNIH